MVIINTISDKYFSLNGVNYAKIYQPLKQGVSAIGIYNINDTRQQLISSTAFSEYKINGLAYGTQEETIEALLPVIYLEDAYFDQRVYNYTGDQIINNITNNPDDEDITESASVLKFKDRNSNINEQKGYKIIRSSFDWTTIDSSYADSILEIRYNFDILGEVINLPDNVILFFNGGLFRNGALVGSNTKIKAGIEKIFNDDIFILGTFNLEYIHPEWFGALPDGLTDNTTAFQKSLDFKNGVIFLSDGTYVCGDLSYKNESGVGLKKGMTIKGKGKESTILKNISNVCLLKIDGSFGLIDATKEYIYDFAIKDLKIISDDVTAHDALQLTATWGFRLENVAISNHNGNAILGILNPSMINPDNSAMISSIISNCELTYNKIGIKANEDFSIENIQVIKTNIQFNIECGIYGNITYLHVSGGSVAFNGTGLTGVALTPNILYGGVSIPKGADASTIARSIRIEGCEMDSNWPQNIYIESSYNASIERCAIASRVNASGYIQEYSIVLGNDSGTIKNYNTEIKNNLFRIPNLHTDYTGQTTTFVLSKQNDLESKVNENTYAIASGTSGTNFFYVEAIDKTGSDDTFLNQIKVKTQSNANITSTAYKLNYFNDFIVTIPDGGVFSFKTTEDYSILCITRAFGSGNTSAIIAYDLQGNALNNIGNSTVNTGLSLFTSTVLDGTNGTAGNVNISEDSTTKKIYISNQKGGSVVVSVSILNKKL